MTDKELPDWTTEMDEEILRLLNSELILTPTVIAENIDRSSGAIARRLNALEAGDLVEKVDRGKYRITPKAAEMFKGGFQVLESGEDSDFQLMVQDRDEWLEERGREEMDQETYGIAVEGMITAEFRDREEPIDYEDAIKEGIRKAEKYFKVVRE